MTAEQQPTTAHQPPRVEPGQQLMERCIDQCLEVVKIASACANWCITSQQASTLADCSQLCLDAATFTATNATMMARGSRFSGPVVKVCADLCAACATECAKHSQHATIMRQCAETCRRCAETCWEMAAVA